MVTKEDMRQDKQDGDRQGVTMERKKRENIKKLATYIGTKKNSEQITASLCELLSKIPVKEINQAHHKF